MSRRVIEISRFKVGAGQDGLSFRLSEPSDTYVGADIFTPLNCTAQDAEFAAISGSQLTKDAMRQAGLRLRASLFGQPAVSQAIQEAITQAKQQGTAVPIYLYMRDGTQAIEPLPWETLCDPQEQFLALDSRWPIGRMSGGRLGEADPRTFNPPIRMLALLSAATISAQGEWDALYDALSRSTMPIDLQVLIAEPDLEQHISQRAVAPNVQVAVKYLNQPFDLAQVIENADFSPHIIHFFCHGSTIDGPSLLLATKAGWEQDSSDIEIGPEEFRRIPGWDKHLWLVTLNCCEGAAAEQETNSFARTLVTELKIPAVAAMREAVKVEDANIFCSSFYAALLREIKPSLDTGESFVSVEWAKALVDPRFSICKAYATSTNTKPSSAAAASKEWALPVIYVRASDFKLRAVSAHSPLSTPDRIAKKAELDQLRRLLADLPAETPQVALTAIKQRVADLEAELLA
jgi:hypothetical protein